MRTRDKEKAAAYQKKWYAGNKEKAVASCKAWYEANKEKVNAKTRAWQEANKGKVATCQKAWKAANKEKVAAYNKAWKASNKEKSAAWRKAYYITNKEKIIAYHKTRNRDNPQKAAEIAKRSKLKNSYGMSVEKYNETLAAQNGGCKICGVNDPGGRTGSSSFHIDHCHATNKVRGLLCCKCNIGLGYFRDSQELLIRATEYLEENTNGS